LTLQFQSDNIDYNMQNWIYYTQTSYQEWWRDWPDETRQPAFICVWCQILQV